MGHRKTIGNKAIVLDILKNEYEISNKGLTRLQIFANTTKLNNINSVARTLNILYDEGYIRKGSRCTWIYVRKIEIKKRPDIDINIDDINVDKLCANAYKLFDKYFEDI